MTLEADDVLQWRDRGEGNHPMLPAHALRLANQMLDQGVTGGPFDAGSTCDLEVLGGQVRFRLAQSRRRGMIES